MKKILILYICFSISILTGCNNKNEIKNNNEYPFTKISWVRYAKDDTEILRLGPDGEFTYYCSCGNPVNDSDLCETYTYNNKTKEIKLKCIDTTENTITKIKIIKVTEDKLELDFNGDIRIFEKEK